MRMWGSGKFGIVVLVVHMVCSKHMDLICLI